METLISIYLFMLSINVGLMVVTELVGFDGGGGEVFPQLIPAPVNASTTAIEQQCELPAYQDTKYCVFVAGNTQLSNATSTGLNSNLTFGDWFTGMAMFFNIFSMGYLMDLLAIVAFPASFIFGMKLIFLFVMGMAAFYIVTGRGSRAMT